MLSLDELGPNYSRFIDHWPDAPGLRNACQALAACYESNSHGIVDHVKAIVECACRTILSDEGNPKASEQTTLGSLLVESLKCLGLEQEKGSSKLNTVLSSFNKIAEALNEMRNEAGVIGHGKDGFVESLVVHNSQTLVLIGNAILGLLLDALLGHEPDLIHTRHPHSRFSRINQRIDSSITLAGIESEIDDAGGTRITISLTIGGETTAVPLVAYPSQLLYELDRESYKEFWTLLSAGQAATLSAEDIDKPKDRASLPSGFANIEQDDIILVEGGKYQGRLSVLEPRVRQLLVGALSVEESHAHSLEKMAASLLSTLDDDLVLDWQRQERAQARIRTSFGKTLRRLGLTGDRAKQVQELVLPALLGDPIAIRASNGC